MNITRRQLLKRSAAAGMGGLIAAQASTAQAPATAPRSSPLAFRFAHLTDVHVQPELQAAQGFAAALKAVEALKPRPDFILTGGDLVFDVLEAPPDRAHRLFELYKTVLRDHTSLPVHNAVGNHDVFGWANQRGVTPDSPGYGKALVKQSLGLERTYYRFDHKGWRFFVLDNIQPGHGSETYQGYLDNDQRDWLAAELKNTDPRMPVVMCEHIPLLSVTPFWSGGLWKDHTCQVSSGLICSDVADRLHLIQGHNVRLCLSGHIHQRDRIEYRGTTFINDGAVCGSWWKGPHQGVPEGFGVIDLWADGRVDHQYVMYGWKPQR